VPVQLPVLFNASLSVAHRVSYDPGQCDGLKGQFTVQKAIDRLSRVASLYAAGGDGGEVMPGKPLARKLRVMLASECGPLSTTGAVEWRVVTGTGKLNGGAGPVLTTPSGGFAEVDWALDGTTHYQEVEARINPALNLPSAEPTSVFFSATLSTAAEVAYTPGEQCGGDMKAAGIDTVEKALNWFCQHQGHGGCSVTVGEGGDFATLAEALATLKDHAAVNVCLLPGTHQVTGPIRLERDFGTVRISGSGIASMVVVTNKGGFSVGPLASFAMRDVMMLSGVERVLRFNGCSDVVLEHCFIAQQSFAAPMITVAAAGTVRVAECILFADKPPQTQPGAGGPVVATLNPAFVDRMRGVRASATTVTLGTLVGSATKTAGGRTGGGGGGGVHAMQTQQQPTGAGANASPPFGEVLALLDTTASNYLVDNVFLGYVRLYGEGKPLGLAQLQQILNSMKKVPLPQNGGALFMRGNQLWAVRLDGSAMEVTPPTGGQGRVPFRQCTLTDNTFWDSFSQVLAAHHSLAGNQWIEIAGGDLMVVAGLSATLTGNTAAVVDGTRVFVSAPANRVAPAANLVQVVVL
jgi:hypothetical protein